MVTINHNSKSSKSTTATSTPAAAKPRTKKRAPPVAERVTVNASPAVPAIAPAATPPPVALAAPAATPPPPATIPAVPAGFVPPNPADTRGFRVLASQVAAVPDAITALQGFSNYTAVFGITAPDVGQLSQRLAVAYDWTMLLSQTAAFYKYARAQHGMAWKDALQLMDALKAPFDLASAANPVLLSQYPAVARLLGAKTIVAKRAAASRVRNKKTAAAKTAAGGGGTTAAPSTVEAPQAAAAPSAADANGAGAAARVVTVTG